MTSLDVSLGYPRIFRPRIAPATPGTPSHSNLALLAVAGNQPLSHG
jgi:hypothetical protein